MNAPGDFDDKKSSVYTWEGYTRGVGIDAVPGNKPPGLHIDYS